MDEYRGKPIKALEFGTDFVFGDRVTAEGRVFIIPDEARVWPFGYTDGPPCIEGFIEVIPDSVGQSTGLDDIWGGDILAFSVFDMHDNDTQCRGVVKFSNGEWQLWNPYSKEGVFGDDGPFSLYWVLSQDVEAEVIGNTTDTPELLEKQT